MTAPPLLRATVVGGRRRLDLHLPAEVPVVELVPELARASGLPVTGAWALASITGEPLDPERSLARQEVPDGVLLVLRPDPLPAPRLRHDDPVEAWTAGRPAPVGPGLEVAVAAVVVGLLTSLAALVGPLPSAAVGPVAAMAAALFCAVPGVAALALGTPSAEGPIGVEAAAAQVRRAVALTAVLGAGLGATIVVLVPALVASGPAGLALATACGVVLLDRAAPGTARLPGAAVLATAVGSGLLLPEVRPVVAAVLVLVGAPATLLLGSGARWPVWLPRHRLVDAVGVVALVALAPSAAVTSGLPDLVRELVR